MDYTIENGKDACQVTLHGAFTFSDSTAFRSIIRTCGETPTLPVIIDLAHVEFVDSAALGMLLLLREEMSKRNCSIVLRRAHGQVHKMFELSKFADFFTLEK